MSNRKLCLISVWHQAGHTRSSPSPGQGRRGGRLKFKGASLRRREAEDASLGVRTTDNADSSVSSDDGVDTAASFAMAPSAVESDSGAGSDWSSSSRDSPPDSPQPLGTVTPHFYTSARTFKSFRGLVPNYQPRGRLSRFKHLVADGCTDRHGQHATPPLQSPVARPASAPAVVRSTAATAPWSPSDQRSKPRSTSLEREPSRLRKHIPKSGGASRPRWRNIKPAGPCGHSNLLQRPSSELRRVALQQQ